MQKKVLFLVAGERQMPVIEYAKQKGYYIITCDNNPLNVGHQLVDEVINIDVYDKKNIYSAVKHKGIDAIVNFVSEHGLETAAYLTGKTGMEGLKPEVLSRLMDKGKFRSLLVDNSFDVPKNIVVSQFREGLDEGLEYPLIVKPVDRGGSLGISKVVKDKELKVAFDRAKCLSNSGEVIIEEFIVGTAAINGDFVVVDNKVIAHLIGDYRYDAVVNPVLPFATTFPSKVDTVNILGQLNRLVEIINVKDGVFNFEAIISGEKAYIIEINPRHSGNLIYKLMEEAMGMDFAEVTVEMACGKKYTALDFNKQESYLAYSLIYTPEQGMFDKVELSPVLTEKTLEALVFKKPGDIVHGFETLYDRIGLLLLKFSSQSEMDNIIDNIKNHYKVYLK